MRRDDQRLNDILEALDWIARAVSRMTEAEFVADDTLCYAVAQHDYWRSGREAESRSQGSRCFGTLAGYRRFKEHSGA